MELDNAIEQLKASDRFVGRHLLLDVQTHSSRGINEVHVIYRLLEELSSVLDMTLVYPPLVARFPFASSELSQFVRSLTEEGIQARTVSTMQDLLAKRNSEDSGISGITVWLESHAAIHTWTEENFFSFDAYSCKDFDPEIALSHVLAHFDVASYNGLDIVRTIDAPQHVRVLSPHPQPTVVDDTEPADG
ncbi:MAG: S-adenosylmethionine decarboxylase [Pseudomonadota bacterium]